ncbi:site-specific recombinase XerD [Arcticibacter pallidicorallinus]|uniref:Site-specific recombinase XerD n=1 Tax=Arcticibacter pallidicorallinus TaxID=1259464 RepID=A0A2T0U0T7_9SPHI|nr:site-specific integrase [Arcticibacter pallidicorallinus]PRY51537.1 site-specific recombinase XerD [Arcticibacter pallidicorallinus]
MKTKWEGPFIYEPPNGDLDKDWLVWIKYQHPVTGKLERFRYNVGFKQYNTKQERREHGKALKIVLEDLLAEGWSPYNEYDVFAVHTNKNVVSLIDQYLEEVKGNIRSSTYKKYKIELNSFKNYLISNRLYNLELDEVKKATVLNFLNVQKNARKWKGKTYNHYLNDITTFFNYFHHNYDDYIEKVPTLSLKRAPIERPGNTAFNDWQFKKLKDLMLDNNDQMLYTFCSFIYYAALRNEAEGNYLKAGDFNFTAKTLKINSGTAKNRKTEYIPIYPDFMELLLELKVPEIPGDYYIFGKESRQKFVIGGPLPVGQDYFARHFRKYKEMLNLSERDGIYNYKHTRAVHLGEDGEDLYKIMKLFRHKDLATTMIYMRDLGINVQNTEFNKGRRF